jgi:hypothetical protein
MAQEAIEKKQVEGSFWEKTDFRETKTQGCKQFYKCTQCDNSLFVNYFKQSSRALVYTEEKEHEHSDTSSYFIPKDTKEKILDLIKKGQKPKQVITYLKQHPNLRLLTSTQINNLMQRSKNQIHLKTKIAASNETNELVEFKSKKQKNQYNCNYVIGVSYTPEKFDKKFLNLSIQAKLKAKGFKTNESRLYKPDSKTFMKQLSSNLSI